MKKKILAFMLCFAFLFNIFPMNAVVNAAGETITYTVKADKTEAYPGDTITYTITMKQTGGLSGIEFTADIPEGLTYVDGSVSTTQRSYSIRMG